MFLSAGTLSFRSFQHENLDLANTTCPSSRFKSQYLFCPVPHRVRASVGPTIARAGRAKANRLDVHCTHPNPLPHIELILHRRITYFAGPIASQNNLAINAQRSNVQFSTFNVNSPPLAPLAPTLNRSTQSYYGDRHYLASRPISVMPSVT